MPVTGSTSWESEGGGRYAAVVVHDHRLQDEGRHQGDLDPPGAASLVRRLIREATSDYLVPATAENQYNHRGDVVAKRFGRLKNSRGGRH